MKRKGKIVRLYGHLRVLTRSANRSVSSSDWVNLAGHSDEGLALGHRHAADRTETPSNRPRTSRTGYRVVGDKLILLEPKTASAPAA